MNYSSTAAPNNTLDLLSHQLVSNATASQFNIFGAPSGSFLNCGTLDSVTQYLAKDSDPLCEKIRVEHRECCRYSESEPTPGPATGYLSNVSLPTFQPCHVCVDGSSIRFPNKTIQLGSLPVHNCSQLETFSSIFHQANDSHCGNIQLFLGSYCGCPVARSGCSFCPNGEPVPFPDRPFPVQTNLQGESSILRRVAEDMTCGEYESILSNADALSGIGDRQGYTCLMGQFRSGECGCSQGYQAKLITWLFRASACLSLIGSLCIIRDVAKKSLVRRTTYHHIILGTTTFDLITSIAYLMSGILLPPPAYEAFGSHATCITQGVLIQIGLTSLFYSVLLSIYYLLLIKYNWKETQFRKYRNQLHIPIVATGLILAAAASTSMAPQLGFCYIAIPPQSASRLRIVALFVIPASLALAIIVTFTLLTCYHVYSTEKASLRWSAKRNLKLTKKVCWQSFCYCIVFAVTVPCVMLNYYGDFQTSKYYREFAIAAFFAPSQGFLNSLIYFKRASKGLKFTVQAAHRLSTRWTRSKPEPAKEGRPCWDQGSVITLDPQSSTRVPSTVEQQQCAIGGANEQMSSIDFDGLPERSEHNDCEMPMEDSDIFSAAAEHWLIDEDEHLNEHAEPPQRRKTTSTTSQHRLLRFPLARKSTATL